MIIVKGFTQTSIVIANLAQKDKPSNSVSMYSYVYNGSSYVNCYVQVNTYGEVKVMDMYGGLISGAQLAYLKTNCIVYIV